MTLTARCRLLRIDDGLAPWTTGRCSMGGNTTAGNRDLHLPLAELTNGTRWRKVLTLTRADCAHRLLRDFVRHKKK